MQRKLSVVSIALIASLVGLAGCSPPAVSVSPIYASKDDEKVVSEPRIEGEWVALRPDLEGAGSEDELWLQVSVEPSSDGRYSVEVCPIRPKDWDGEQVTRYDLALVLLNDKLFFDATFDKSQTGTRSITGGTYLGLVPAHILGRIWVKDGLLQVKLPTSDWAEYNLSEALRQTVEVSGDKGFTVITASTPELQKIIGSNVDAFDANAYRRRPRHTQGSARVQKSSFGRGASRLRSSFFSSSDLRLDSVGGRVAASQAERHGLCYSSDDE